MGAIRRFSEPATGYEPPHAEVSDRIVRGRHGDIPVRIYEPSSRDPSGAGVVWLHGGGFVGGDLDMPEADVTAREMCAQVGATVVSVGYHLVRDDGCFPVPHDDIVDAWLWTAEAAEDLGISRDWMVLGGCSAGGNLATGAALALRDTQGPRPKLLVLAYPVLHDELPPVFDLPQEVESVPALLRFTPDAVAAMNDIYRGGAAPSPYSVPAIADLEGLPETAILTCEYDFLRVSGEDFAEALRAAGVPVALRREPGVVHAYLSIPGLPGWEHSIEFIVGAIEAAAPGAP
jgi:acetyl esterase/lipase